MIKVLVVDDSAVAREFVSGLLNADAELQVVGTASDGAAAVAAVQRLRPDVITMDINMPRLDGFAATRSIMEMMPTPIVIVSGRGDAREMALTFQAVAAGALAILARPPGSNHPQHAASVRELVRTVKLMSEVKVVRRRAGQPTSRLAVLPVGAAPGPPGPRPTSLRLVAMGASTGGPPVLRSILAALPTTFPAPVVVVQHIARDFTAGLVEWLAAACACPVGIPRDGERLLAGQIYIAPEGVQLGITPDGCAALRSAPPEHGMCPSVSYLFRSVCAMLGPQAIGVLLTGMGTDGAVELKALRDSGAITIAQDFASSVIHGMPGEAIRLGGADYVCSADAIAGQLIQLSRLQPEARRPLATLASVL